MVAIVVLGAERSSREAGGRVTGDREDEGSYSRMGRGSWQHAN